MFYWGRLKADPYFRCPDFGGLERVFSERLRPQSETVALSSFCYVPANTSLSWRLWVWRCHKSLKDNSHFIIGELRPAADNFGLSTNVAIPIIGRFYRG